jgi:hypothetical protein
MPVVVRQSRETVRGGNEGTCEALMVRCQWALTLMCEADGFMGHLKHKEV